MTEKKQPKRVKFITNWPKDYKIYPANSAWGAVSGRGDFIIHFLLERRPIPAEDVQNVSEDGLIVPIEREPPEEMELVRDMQVGIMINREQTVSIANWMLQQVKDYEALRKGEAKK